MQQRLRRTRGATARSGRRRTIGRRGTGGADRSCGGRGQTDGMVEGVRPLHLAVVGTTASGKSALAMALARRRGDVELVSVDSMQVYRGMDIGTAKPTAAERAEVRHHVLDLVDPWEPFDVWEFQQAVRAALDDIARRGRRAVLVGGTGLYLRAVIDDLELPGRFPDVAAESGRRPRHRGPARAAGRAGPARRHPHGADQPSARPARPGGDDRQRPAVLVVRARAGVVSADGLRPRRAWPCPATSSWTASPAATSSRWRTASSTRSAASPPDRRSATPRPRRSATASCSPTSPGRPTSTRRSTSPSPAPASWPDASAPGSAATPASPGSPSTTIPLAALPALESRAAALWGPP